MRKKILSLNLFNDRLSKFTLLFLASLQFIMGVQLLQTHHNTIAFLFFMSGMAGLFCAYLNAKNYPKHKKLEEALKKLSNLQLFQAERVLLNHINSTYATDTPSAPMVYDKAQAVPETSEPPLNVSDITESHIIIERFINAYHQAEINLQSLQEELHRNTIKARQGDFSLRIKEKVLAKRIEEKERLEHELQHNIEETEKAHAEAVKARKAAETANAAKSEFLANMSHELRTPLNGILGMLRLLRDHNLANEERSLVEAIDHSSKNLLLIVNDILDLSKIEAGGLNLESIGFDLSETIRSVVASLAPIAREKQLTLQLDVPEQSFPFIMGDPVRVSQILTNLIGNALKYTEHGGISILAAGTTDHNQKFNFTFTVTDTGIGIAENKLGSIFDKFVQADNSTTRKFGGTGLGLTITKQLVELMGGTINVESQLGKGSCFKVNLHFDISQNVVEENGTLVLEMPEGIVEAEKAKILIAEDHPMNQLLLSKMLKRLNIGTVKIAADGVEAVELYKQSSWDLILMDCHMPKKNGYEATTEIRQIESQSLSKSTIIALTADAMVGTKEKCLSHGMDEYISKPIDFDRFKILLAKWIKF